MPQFIALGLIAAGGYYAFKVLKREMARVDREVRAAEKVRTDDRGELLVRDPETGHYRPPEGR
ncbi:hypothetical protein J2R99_000601 [Rhodopseudomonas julia]|uniref:Uncharacterized protein n=1 Tax=Rhodopseudomonas julia TaxID=200617 RepID=A0ABU0C3E4_9BRAD|nr:hypothetical protein [Rhodopseudomonas julia]MDQ0324752.1 hypothetical protein [Rhodopseudomonas julia]